MNEPELVERLQRALAVLLAEVPTVRLDRIEREVESFVIRLLVLQLRHALSTFGTDATPVFAAPYVSPESRAVCTEAGVGFLDLEGNARIAFDGVFIDRRVEGKPAARRRDLRSLFKPRSARVLRRLLRDPSRRWRVAELSAATGVSLGHISNVRTALLDREGATVAGEGLFLSAPGRLLDAWREAYEAPPGERRPLYTVLHGSALDEAVRPALRADSDRGRCIYASFSAAQWIAPYARTSARNFYADEAGSDRLALAMRATPSTTGGNVTIVVTRDDGVFLDAVEPMPGVACTSPVQTYLDLCAAGERGKEAAEHLREERLAWSA